jgi:hypothetical protein
LPVGRHTIKAEVVETAVSYSRTEKIERVHGIFEK